MHDLLFYLAVVALLCYFFIYLPSQKKLNHQPSNQSFISQETQTDNLEPTNLETLQNQLTALKTKYSKKSQFLDQSDLENKKLRGELEKLTGTITELATENKTLWTDRTEAEKVITNLTKALQKFTNQL